MDDELRKQIFESIETGKSNYSGIFGRPEELYAYHLLHAQTLAAVRLGDMVKELIDIRKTQQPVKPATGGSKK